MHSIHSSLLRVIQSMPWIKLSPEESVLLQLSNNVVASKKSYTVIQKMAGVVNWQRLLKLIRQNRLQVVCKDSFNSQVFQSVAPKEFSGQIVSDQIAIQLFAIKNRRPVIKVARSFRRAGIEFVVMKTLPQEHMLFRSPIKIAGDLDILLPVSSVKLAGGILTKLGYECFWNHEKTIKNTAIGQDFYLPLSEHIFKKGNTTVELHTAVVNSSSFASRILSDYNNRRLTQELFNKKKRGLYHGAPIHIFTPTSLFVSLFIHLLYQHNLQSVIRYYELYSVVRSYNKSIRWTEVLRLIQAYHLTPFYYWFVCLFNDLFPNSFPIDILQSAKKIKTSFRLPQRMLYSVMKRRLFHPSDHPFNNNEKRICWAIITNQLAFSPVSYLRRMLTIHPL